MKYEPLEWDWNQDGPEDESDNKGEGWWSLETDTLSVIIDVQRNKEYGTHYTLYDLTVEIEALDGNTFQLSLPLFHDEKLAKKAAIAAMRELLHRELAQLDEVKG